MHMSAHNPVLQLAVDHDEVLPAALPAEVTAAIDAAFESAAALADAGRELHFALDHHRGLAIEVRDLQGDVIRTISPSQALGIMSGFGGD